MLHTGRETKSVEDGRSARISSLILKVAELCNLNCSYCYMYNHEDKTYLSRPRFIEDNVFDSVLAAVRKHCELHAPHAMNLVFHGGEPTLIGKTRFSELCQRATEFLGNDLRQISVQTNATLLNDDWIEVFKRHNVSVGVSLDGPQFLHDIYRVDHQGSGSHNNTIQGLKLLQAAGLNPGVLCVINPAVSGLEIYNYFRSLGLSNINFLLPDTTHNTREKLYGPSHLTPVADYLIPIFDQWIAEDEPENLVRIFWGLLRAMMGGEGETDVFGSPNLSYLVIETDGEIQTIDALRVCEEGIANTGLNILRNDLEDLQIGAPLLSQLLANDLPLAETCLNCSEIKVCAGGYVPHRYANENGFDNPSVWCKDILKLTTHIRNFLNAQSQSVSPASCTVC